MIEPYRHLSEIEDLVARFEDCSLPCGEWTHRAHLAVGLWFVARHPPAAALDRVRGAIQRYNAACGTPNTATRGYHETLTRFYVWLIGKYLADVADRADWLVVTNGLLARHGDRDAPLSYYTREVLMSAEARAGWVPPNVRALD